jgi:hypothetical protein
VTPRERERLAWLGALIGIADLTGKTVAEVAAKRTPPYAKPGDGEAEITAQMAADYDANPPPANDNGDSSDDGDDDDGYGCAP